MFYTKSKSVLISLNMLWLAIKTQAFV